jgi:NADH-quinone oxidoreductase subunit M
MPTLLLVLLALPLATAVAVALLGAAGPKVRAIRALCLFSTLTTLVLAGYLTWAYASSPPLERGASEFKPLWVPGSTEASPHGTTWTVLELPGSTGVQFYVGLDGLNVWLVLLTALLLVPSVLISWNSIEERIPEYYAWLMVLEAGMIGVFLAFDIVLFYVFFELTLVPLFFLIGIWGGPQRQYAARKFFVYTLAGSLFTLLGVLGMAVTTWPGWPEQAAARKVTFSIPELVQQADAHRERLQKNLDQKREDKPKAAASVAAVKEKPVADEKEQAERVNNAERALAGAESALARAEGAWSQWRRLQFWVFAALMCGFAIKVPLVPVHTWLPLAHTEAPTAGSVLLAGVLLKIGSYGFLRLCLPLAPEASLTFGAPLVGVLAVIGIIYGAFCALGQHDIKKLVAYSSVSHMGFCMLGLFAATEVGLAGGILQMINHGLSTGALFLLVGMLYDRYHTRKMADYGGMGARLKLLATFFVFITLTSIGLPGLNGFVGEMLVLVGIYGSPVQFIDGRLLSILAISGVVLGAWYMLTLVLKVFFGPVREPAHGGHAVADLNGRELAALVPIALVCLALGLYPQPVLQSIEPDVKTVAGILDRARLGLQADPRLRGSEAPSAVGDAHRAGEQDRE